MLYLLIFLILLLFSYNEVFTSNDKLKKTLYIASYYILVVLAGLRYETGGDWQSYAEVFDIIEPINEVIKGNGHVFANHQIEIGFRLLISITKFFSSNVQLLFFIVSFGCLTLLFKNLSVYSSYPQTSILIYYSVLYFFLDFVTIRQAISVMIFFFSIRFIQNRNLLKYIALIVTASFFHLTALLLLPLYWIINKRFSSNKVIIFFITINLVFLLNIKWMEATLNLVLPFFLGPVATKITTYTAESALVGRGISIGFIINIIIFTLLMLTRSKNDGSKYYNIFFNLFLLYAFVYSVFFEIVDISNRFRLYFALSELILLPNLFIAFETYKNKILIFIFVTLFSFSTSRNIFLERTGGSAYNPYQNYIIYKMFDIKSTGKERLEINDKDFEENK